MIIFKVYENEKAVMILSDYYSGSELISSNSVFRN